MNPRALDDMKERLEIMHVQLRQLEGWCDEMREMIYKERDRIDREEEIFFAQMESQYCDRLR
jgi:hypothetical protein